MKKRVPHEQTTGRLEPLVRIGDPNEANLLAAQLRSEGIPVHVHGELAGPYPVGVGGLAEVELWVDEDHMAQARAVVAEFRL
jgi:hypothetical protein